ncbi:MAG: hypothetical protein IJ353_07300 [Lachnospiraceae bacterium]|nr:hypothetical protein [Lachnospiraceae bacterium]
MKTVLFQDDFKQFPIGEFPYDKNHSAMGEYNYIVNEGYYGGWVDMVCNHTYNGSGASWIITEDEGKHFMEQMRLVDNRPHKTHPMLMTGTNRWNEYTVSATIRSFNTDGSTGIGFKCINSLNLYVFVLEDKKAKLLYRHKQKETELASCEFDYNCDDFYVLTAACEGNTVRCFINGIELFSYAEDRLARSGKIAITATTPAQFTDVKVLVSEEALTAIKQAEQDESTKVEQQTKLHPGMKLFKKIDLKNFGTGRQIRFGHLTGGDKWYIVLAQGQRRVRRDDCSHISCLTAIDLDGNILWQRGEPSTEREQNKISADYPLQVYDIDGDGIDEVITAKNFELLILDGRTGEIKKKAKMPFSDKSDTKIIGVPNGVYPFDRINADGIRICNVSGKDRPTDLLIKDRYCRIYLLNSDLELLWSFRSDKNTGHFPYACDINQDGYDEILCGYNLLDHNGKLLWSYPIQSDHTDEIISGRFMAGSSEGHFACVSGSEGFFIGDYHGNIIKRDDIGHAQRVSTGNYCPEWEGFELAVVNYWGHQGIVYLYDSEGNPLWEFENELNGNMLTPVNWDGTGQDLILLNADSKRGGLLDGNGIRCVEFPEDGHPTMCAEAINLTGDARDELVVWDYQTMYIYTQDDGFMENAYAPVKYPYYNGSNYRGEYSYPSKEYVV